jgi:tetratricopeptide (TPR) repeat protein
MGLSQTVKDTSTYKSNVSALLIEAKKEALFGNLEKGIQKFNDLIKIYPSCDAAYYELAKISDSKGLIYQSINQLKKAYQIDSTNKWYAQALAQLYQATGKYDSTTLIYINLIKQFPNNPDYYYNLSNNYIYSNDVKNSISTYNRAEKKFGISEDIVLEKYKLYLSVNDTINAIKEIEKLTVKFPKETKYYSLLARLYNQQGNYKKAEWCYKTIEKINSNDPYIHITLSDFYKERNNPKKAFEELKKGFSSKNLESDFKLKVFEQYLNDTIKPFLREKDAVELSEIIVTTHPNDIKAILVRGNALFIHKKYRASKDYFYKALVLDSVNVYALDYFIRSSLILNDTSHLEPFLKKAIRILPNNTYYFYFLGSILFSKKEYQNVIELLQSGLLTATNIQLKEELNLQLAEAYYYNKQDSLSTEYYRKVIISNPKNVLALNNLSYHLLQKNKDLPGALELAEQAVLLAPNNSNNLDTYAWALYKTNKLLEAKKEIKKAIKKGGKKNDTILEHYGDILSKMGEQEKALRYWKKASKFGTGSELLKQKIEQNKLIE